MKDHEHPFFRPLWRRVAVVAICLGWAALEFSTGSSGWGWAALAFAAYGAWQFFFLYKPVEAGKAKPETGTQAETGTPDNTETKE